MFQNGSCNIILNCTFFKEIKLVKIKKSHKDKLKKLIKKRHFYLKKRIKMFIRSLKATMKMRLSLLQRLMKQPSSLKLITMKNTKMNLEANKLKKLHKQQKNQKIGFNKITLKTKGLLKLKERKK